LNFSFRLFVFAHFFYRDLDQFLYLFLSPEGVKTSNLEKGVLKVLFGERATGLVEWF
jgi:hypothetical protein